MAWAASTRRRLRSWTSSSLLRAVMSMTSSTMRGAGGGREEALRRANFWPRAASTPLAGGEREKMGAVRGSAGLGGRGGRTGRLTAGLREEGHRGRKWEGRL